MSVAGTLVSSARHYRGLSGRVLARRAGTSQPTIAAIENGRADATTGRLERLLQPLGYQLTVLPTRLGTAVACAERVRGRLARGEVANAERAVLQLAADLQRADPALRVALSVTPPAPVGDTRFDAYIAAVVEHFLAHDGLPLPGWLAEPSRTLSTPWDIESIPSLQPAARSLTPEAFVRHGIYLDPINLMDA